MRVNKNSLEVKYTDRGIEMNNWGKVFITVICLVIVIGLVVSGGCMPQTREAKKSANTFLTYEKYNQWDQVWEMLHSDSQNAWPDRQIFMDQMNQPSSNLVHFKMEKARILPSWTHPSTNISYANVVEIPVVLVFSTVYGKLERYQMLHTVNVNGNWKFFQYPRR
jgi:hypothetical protein